MIHYLLAALAFLGLLCVLTILDDVARRWR